MKRIDDNELDSLITEAFGREEIKEMICRSVEKTIVHRKRRAAWKRVAAAVIISFGMPMLAALALFAYLSIYRHAGPLPFPQLWPVLSAAVLICAFVIFTNEISRRKLFQV